MNCIASIAAVVGLSVQPAQAFFRSGHIVIEHSICGPSGTERGMTRVSRNRHDPIEHHPSQTMACAHALRPNGLFESDDACEDAGEN